MARYNVWVRKNGSKFIKVRRGGTTKLTELQVARLERVWKRERAALKAGKRGKRGWTAFRKKQIVRKPKLRERAWAEARKDLGVMESGGNNRGPGVEAIIHDVGGVVGAPWCGYSVAHWYKQAGSKSVTWQWAAVRFLGAITGQRKLSQRSMKLGDIVVFDFDHTGLFGWYSDSAGNKVGASTADYIVTIEGNTGSTGAVSDSKTGGDGVYKKVRPIHFVAYGVRVMY